MRARKGRGSGCGSDNNDGCGGDEGEAKERPGGSSINKEGLQAVVWIR